jgi:predicted nuclease with TOPRIM domain
VHYDYNDIVEYQRAAWLSRQPEVDELKRQVEELMAFNETCLQNNKSLTAAKEKELEELKEQLGYNKFGVGKLIEQNAKLKATHNAEMCAFAEWIDENELVRIIKYGDVKWYSNKIGDAGVFEKPHTTIELLTKFRER